MNYKLAFEILEIDMSEKKYSDINLEYLKRFHEAILSNLAIANVFVLYQTRERRNSRR